MTENTRARKTMTLNQLLDSAKYGGKIITNAEIEAAYQARLAAKGGAR